MNHELLNSDKVDLLRAELKRQYAAHQEMQGAYEREISELQEKVAEGDQPEGEALRQLNEELERQYAAHDEMQGVYEREISELQRALAERGENEELEKVRRELEQQYASHEKMQNAYEGELAELQKIVDQDETRRREELQEVRDEMQRQYDAHEKTQEAYEGEISSLHGHLKNVQGLLREAGAAIRAVDRNLEDVPGRFTGLEFVSHEESQGWRYATAEELEARTAEEQRMFAAALDGRASPTIEGFCAVCDKPSEFHLKPLIDQDLSTFSLRETLQCSTCYLHNRQRAVLHFLDSQALPLDRKIYITEQTTVLYKKLVQIYEHTVGSEFIGDSWEPGAVDDDGIRHEDLTRLSFADERFDVVASFEVLEHVPDYAKALREIYRVLKPGGKFLLTTPFGVAEAETLVRARITESGEIEHLTEPEYHGDPMRDEGCLSFYRFGWDLLETLREIGFVRTRRLQYWSRENAYLGEDQYILIAERDGGEADDDAETRSQAEEHSVGLRALSQTLKDQISELETDLARFRRERLEIDQRHDDMQEAYEQAIARMREDHERETQRLQESLDRAADDRRDMKEVYEAEIRRLGETVEAMQDDHAADLRRRGESEQEMQRTYEAEVRRLKESVETMREDHADDIRRRGKTEQEMQDAYEAEIRRLKETVGTMQEDHDVEIRRREAHEQSMQEAYEAEVRRLKETVARMEENHAADLQRRGENEKKMQDAYEAEVARLQGILRGDPAPSSP